jgi:hypothetical protein
MVLRSTVRGYIRRRYDRRFIRLAPDWLLRSTLVALPLRIEPFASSPVIFFGLQVVYLLGTAIGKSV